MTTHAPGRGSSILRKRTGLCAALVVPWIIFEGRRSHVGVKVLAGAHAWPALQLDLRDEPPKN